MRAVIAVLVPAHSQGKQEGLSELSLDIIWELCTMALSHRRKQFLIKDVAVDWTRSWASENWKNQCGWWMITSHRDRPGSLCDLPHTPPPTPPPKKRDLAPLFNFLAKCMSHLGQLSSEEEGSFIECFQMSVAWKIKLSCWLLQSSFLQASNLRWVQKRNLLSPSLVRNWI